MDRIYDFLTELSVDPFQQLAYAQDPAGVAAAAGLGSEEQAALTREKLAELASGASSDRYERCACIWQP
ncbi:hypothetical protein WMF37_20380 [Sorangium sp. So ce291]|uniref:hypothetical protein n=1 Tax=Sorangium sp. So ce291 TaxID=3133294 RepID=UPI003F61F2A8